MVKRTLSVVLTVAVLCLSGLFLGCEDEIDTHEEIQIEKTTQEPVVVP